MTQMYHSLSTPVRSCEGYSFESIDTQSQHAIIRQLASYLGTTIETAESIAMTLYFDPFYDGDSLMVGYRISVYIKKLYTIT